MNNVPHFDQAGHFQNQQSQEERRRRRNAADVGEYDASNAADMALRFVLVSGILAFASLPVWLFKKDSASNKTRDRDFEK